MIVKAEQIQRPQLFVPLFNALNEFIKYIYNTFSPSSKKSVTPKSHNIQKSLKIEKRFNELKARLSQCTTEAEVDKLNDEFFNDLYGYVNYTPLLVDKVINIRKLSPQQHKN